MPISPELKHIPGIALTFTKAGLTTEIISDLIVGNKVRNLARDASRLVQEYAKSVNVEVEGIKNVPDGGLIAFNHPNNDVLLPAMLKVINLVDINFRKDIVLVIASEIMLTAKLNEKTALPGSMAFLKRFHAMYPQNIISAPTVPSRPDFDIGRALAARKVIKNLRAGNLVAISPEGHVEIEGRVSPKDSFHEGSGSLARLAGKIGKPVLPLGIWTEGDRKNIFIKIGKPLQVETTSDRDAVDLIMENIAELLPNKLRGPYKDYEQRS